MARVILYPPQPLVILMVAKLATVPKGEKMGELLA
jgi:hypothetical protein